MRATAYVIVTRRKPTRIPVFFQAEDGIRAATVTGVQTCALPICGRCGDGFLGGRCGDGFLGGRCGDGFRGLRVPGRRARRRRGRGDPTMSASSPGGLRPALEEFVLLAKEYSVVPVWRELLGDLETPVSAFRKLGGAEGSVLLESVEHGERWGRFSFIGTDPFATFQARDGRVTWTGDPPDGLPSGPPMAVLRAALERLRSPAIPELAPLHAGAVGYLAYDIVRELERLPDQTD